MVVHCMNALKEEHINKVSLIAFTQNDIGNAFLGNALLDKAGRPELL